MSEIKSNCIACGFPFTDMSEARYRRDGNFCSICNGRADAVIQKRITSDEADRMLLERREKFGYHVEGNKIRETRTSQKESS